MSGDGAWAAAWTVLPDYLGQHVLLCLCALALGLAISLPLAVASARLRWLRRPALAFAGVVQTIPGLALVALFYPLLLALSAFTQANFGVGFRALGFLPALLALTFYSMLPVLRNTITGLLGLDPAVLMAARATGMTPRQSLWLVELPLAAPVIMAGVRTAAVWVIGTATLSTPVGQTSLGNYIFTGLQTENWVFVLFGCVAAALLALVIDRLLALAEDGLALRSRARLWGAATGLILVLGASLAPLMAQGRQAIVIGTKNFEEQFILGALIGDRLDKAELHSETHDGLGSSVIFHALAGNDLDLYVDYSGTIWADEMHRRDNPGRRAVLAQMSHWLKQKYGITSLGSLGFENAYVLAMKRSRAEALGIHSIANLAVAAPRLKIGGDLEFFSRPEWTALVKAYGLHFAVQHEYQPTFMYRAVASGDVDVISAFSSDGRIVADDLVLLTDPRHALPPYDAVLLLSPARAHDDRLMAALKPLIGAIPLKAMQQANLLVDRDNDKQTPQQAARFLAAAIRR